MYEELIVALNRYFEGYELKRGDALKAAEAIKQLGTELEREKEKHQHTSEVAFEYEDEIKRIKQERDAAVADLNKYGQCGACKHYPECGANEHSYCDGGFAWRGVQEDAE